MATYKFIVNPLGEAIRNGRCLLGSVNLRELRGELGKQDEDLVTQEEINQWFDREARKVLTAPERRLYNRVVELQAIVNNGRFRIYGGIRAGKRSIKLVTEFLNFTDEVAFWKLLRKVARQTRGRVVTMIEEEHCDSWSEIDPVSGSYGPQQFGPNHGRSERQVELAFEVANQSTARIKAKVEQIEEATKSLWDVAGVGVI